MEAAIITTYRCIAHCQMCYVWKYPTKREDEIRPEILKKLPPLSFCNITGGEPFLRDDLGEIVQILKRKTKRIVISTNGYFTDRILDLTRKDKQIGIRISLEGLAKANDELRGLQDGFDRGLRTLLELQRMGLKDVGFGITVSDRNARDMLELYQMAKSLNLEFATAVVHNSYYFHKHDNEISQKEEVIACFRILVEELLRTKRVKNWYRGYFNYGLINYIRGNPRLLPCVAGEDMFFLDPWGEIRPCNGMDSDSLDNSMGNLNEASFEAIWKGPKAISLREKVKNCPKNCWMIGTASPAMKTNILKPSLWVARNKLRVILGKPICLD